MELKDVFTIVKADRYTDAGRAEIDDARRTYKPGEISEKTGLQKQPNGGWAPPKKGGNAASKGHLESDTPQNLTITKEDEERFGKAALSGISGPRESNTGNRTGTPSPETQKEMKLRREAMSGDPEKRKALFSYEASKADDKEIEMVLSAKERGVNHPADKIEAYKAEKERRSGTDVSKLSKEQIKEFRDMTAEQLKTPYSSNSGVSKESFQKNQETLKKRLNEYDAELAKRSGSEKKGEKDIKKATGDSAPRVLTGDCKVRVKK